MITRRQSTNILKKYTIPDQQWVELQLKEELQKLDHKIIVLDDDPTGIQTVHDVSVYTNWDESALASGFREKNNIFFILTNSRSFTRENTQRVHEEIGEALCRISAEAGKDYILVSRSDSTLRGHYPLEMASLRKSIERHSSIRFDGEIILPFFKEGGRYTIGNIHYVQVGDELVPVGETEFSKDKSFGYKSSHLGEYVEEKTCGEYNSESCVYISIEELRSGDTTTIFQKLMLVNEFQKVIVNAIDYYDVKMFVLAFIKAVSAGKRFLFRSAAALPKVLGGVSERGCLYPPGSA